MNGACDGVVQSVQDWCLPPRGPCPHAPGPTRAPTPVGEGSGRLAKRGRQGSALGAGAFAELARAAPRRLPLFFVDSSTPAQPGPCTVPQTCPTTARNGKG